LKVDVVWKNQSPEHTLNECPLSIDRQEASRTQHTTQNYGQQKQSYAARLPGKQSSREHNLLNAEEEDPDFGQANVPSNDT
jgi:hypothetical protein